MHKPIQTAIILAAGRGRRMWPYDELRPKATLPILNQPVIARLVDDLSAAGIQHVVVVVGHQSQRVKHALAGYDRVAFVQQSSPDGTAIAVLEAMPLVDDETFLVVHGDLLVDQSDVRALMQAFVEGDAQLAALVCPLEREDSRDWLCATVQAGMLTAVEGHSSKGTFGLAGVFALHRSALRYLRDNPGLVAHVPVGGMPPIEADLAASLQMAIEAGMVIPAIIATGPFVDLDKPWHILEANARAIEAAANNIGDLATGAGARISDGADIHGPVILEEGATIGPRTVVSGPLWVGKDTTIDNGPIIGPGVVIGPRCKIANYCQIGGSSTIGPLNVIDHCAEFGGVTMDRVYLSHYMEFWGVIGSAVDLGAATVCGNLRFDDGKTVHTVLGRRETPRSYANAVYIGDYCRTGVNAVLLPGVKVGPYSCVGPGVIAYEDVPARTLVLARQELVHKIWGPARYGW
jgi:UDP-N-acetylglucosamine diphosphorylase / glucose-1-phosphate thymidylyltransferase / UDP-N-acetylgalactosamine diphosphorylase / glucosamine-1-phosphate N-acetyltransferase / galactosamine-1-phosphate N-acetyltransferase